MSKRASKRTLAEKTFILHLETVHFYEVGGELVGFGGSPKNKGKKGRQVKYFSNTLIWDMF